ncbi:MAG: IS1634 family transposase [Emticicia sp.]|nr:IS1634 family transposase [Emticicia sp.]
MVFLVSLMMENTYSSKSLGHLGIVSGMIDELCLVESIDKLLQTDGVAREIGIGTICKALILNGLGFTQRTLYMVPTFFNDKPIDVLLGSNIKASQLNDTVLGRALDSIHSYGCTELYAHLSPQICKKLGLSSKNGHMDSTDFHLDGVFNSRSDEVDEHILHLRPGYSRDHRPDLNQAVLNLIVENQAGIVLHMQALSGNVSDKTAFNDTIKSHISQLQTVHDLDYIIMDSAGYTKDSIESCATNIKWISRVPETLTESKSAIKKTYSNWTFLAEGYQYITLNSDYADIKQRWLLVYSEEAYKRELLTLKKSYFKASQKEHNDFRKLCKSAFDCQNDAQNAIDKFISKCKYLTINDISIQKVAFFDKKGRPKKEEIPTGFHYFIHATDYCCMDTFEKMAYTKGKFIIATNELDEIKLDNETLFTNYKGQSKVERGFRFLKDPQFMAATLFVKKPERVEALLFIMTLCLSVYAAIEFRIRQVLILKNLTLPNQLGKEVKNPTARWIFTCFNPVTVLYANQVPIILNCNDLHRKIIKLMGNEYHKYYFLN